MQYIDKSSYWSESLTSVGLWKIQIEYLVLQCIVIMPTWPQTTNYSFSFSITTAFLHKTLGCQRPEIGIWSENILVVTVTNVSNYKKYEASTGVINFYR